MSPKRAATKTLPSQPARKRKAPTNEDEVTELSVNLVEVDRDGDVLIIVGQGEDKLNIKVSGKVLGLASKVFHSMLSSGFMEASTGVIEMKDDDPEVVLDFCRVLHFDYSCLNDWDVRQMTLIADMADMRCCLEVFTPHILPRLSNLIKEIAKACLDPFITEKITAFLKKEGLTFELVLEIASKLDLNELFHQTVRLAIAQRPALVRLESMGADWNSVVTGDDDLDVYGQIKFRERSLVKNCLREIFEYLHSNFLPATGQNPTNANGVHTCASAKMGVLTFALSMQGITVMDLDAYQGTMVDLEKSILKISDLTDNSSSFSMSQVFPKSSQIFLRPKYCGGACTFCRQDSVDDILEIVQAAGLSVPGLCLPCLKRGGQLEFTEVPPDVAKSVRRRNLFHFDPLKEPLSQVCPNCEGSYVTVSVL